MPTNNERVKTAFASARTSELITLQHLLVQELVRRLCGGRRR